MLEIIGTVLGIVATGTGTWLAVSGYYRAELREYVKKEADREKKEYAAARDFEHLRRNQEGLAKALDELHRDYDLQAERINLRLARLETVVKAVALASNNPAVGNLLDTGNG
jgi:hypothetical protein